MNLREIAAAIRFWSDKLSPAVENFLRIESNRPDFATLESAIGHTVAGASIVIGVSLLERMVTDLSHQQAGAPGPPQPVTLSDVPSWAFTLGVTLSPCTTSLLQNIVRLRHCFAHEYGRATARQKPHIVSFLSDLAAGTIVDDRGQRIDPYYDLAQDDTIELKSTATDRFRRVAAAIVREFEAKGLL